MPTATVTPFVLGDYQTNCYVVSVAGTSDCWIVDCGFAPDALLSWIRKNALNPVLILLTHAHVDHIAGVEQARREFGDLPIWIHEAEAEFCGNPMLNLSAITGFPVTCPDPTRTLRHGEILHLGSSSWRVLHTPGHSPGGATFVNDHDKIALVGDTLFTGSIGRSDFPTSDPAALGRSLFDVLLTLPDDYTVYPGHGPSTSIGAERKHNPFLQQGIQLFLNAS
ncbi:MAG TPA: MBL fold metallo-hydrolase [Phycisphaerales bacterium]|nr:MBL fold metallo-hydrolase [Phycisphaerales bacterium]